MKATVPMIWTGKKARKYNTRMLKPGDPFDATSRDSKIFLATGLAAQDKARRRPGKLSAPPEELRRAAAAASADDDGETKTKARGRAKADKPEAVEAAESTDKPEESTSPSVTQEPAPGDEPPLIVKPGSPVDNAILSLEDARAAYKTKYGRLPHHTWDVEKIRERMGAE